MSAQGAAACSSRPAAPAQRPPPPLSRESRRRQPSSPLRPPTSRAVSPLSPAATGRRSPPAAAELARLQSMRAALQKRLALLDRVALRIDSAIAVRAQCAEVREEADQMRRATATQRGDDRALASLEGTHQQYATYMRMRAALRHQTAATIDLLQSKDASMHQSLAALLRALLAHLNKLLFMTARLAGTEHRCRLGDDAVAAPMLFLVRHDAAREFCLDGTVARVEQRFADQEHVEAKMAAAAQAAREMASNVEAAHERAMEAVGGEWGAERARMAAALQQLWTLNTERRFHLRRCRRTAARADGCTSSRSSSSSTSSSSTPRRAERRDAHTEPPGAGADYVPRELAHRVETLQLTLREVSEARAKAADDVDAAVREGKARREALRSALRDAENGLRAEQQRKRQLLHLQIELRERAEDMRQRLKAKQALPVPPSPSPRRRSPCFTPCATRSPTRVRSPTRASAARTAEIAEEQAEREASQRRLRASRPGSKIPTP